MDIVNKTKSLIASNPFVFLAILLLIVLTLLTHYHGSTDIGDYSDSAKYFAGYFNADTRSSHSYLFGFIHSPFVALTKSYIWFKISSLLFLFSIIYSVYYISGKNKKSLLLALFSPIIWYMSPWINPIQLASLLILWAYFFMVKYNDSGNIKHLILSGMIMGLSGSFWNTSLYFWAALLVSFLYDKKFNQVILFCLATLLGLLPLFAMDFALFNFPFYTIIKTNAGQFLGTLTGSGIYGVPSGVNFLLEIILVLLFLPVYSWILFKPSLVKENLKSTLFVSLSLLVILINPQIRYVLAIAPVVILLISKEIDYSKLKKYLFVSIILIIILLIPYAIQLKYSINNQIDGMEIGRFAQNFNNLKFSPDFPQDIIKEDINEIILEHPKQTFVVGNHPDDYQIVADSYWGKDAIEFVSIQDYSLYLNNASVLFEKKFVSAPRIQDRRQIFIIGGVTKNENDKTDYKNISLGIGLREPINLPGFNLYRKYGLLYLSKKSI